MVTVAVGTGGRVSFYNDAGSTDVLADLAGYFTPEDGASFTSLSPTRVLDTRIGLGTRKAKIGAGDWMSWTIPGLPADTTAVALNVTATAPTANSFLTAYPAGEQRPTASNLNYSEGQTSLVTVAGWNWTGSR